MSPLMLAVLLVAAHFPDRSRLHVVLAIALVLFWAAIAKSMRMGNKRGEVSLPAPPVAAESQGSK
jgi:hypothetical protein